MPNFGADRPELEKTIPVFDMDGPMTPSVRKYLSKRGRPSDHLMMQVMLGALCSLYTADPDQESHFHQRVLESLCEDKIITPNALTSSENEVQVNVMKNLSGWFRRYMQRVFTNMTVGNPRTNTITPRVSSHFFTTAFPNTYEENFVEVEQIASGGFGTVFKVVHKIDGITYAVKKIFYSLNQEKIAKKVLSEVHSIATLSHVNVVSYKNCWVQLLNRDDIKDEGSQSAASSFASRDFSSSTTPCSTAPSSMGKRRPGKKALFQSAESGDSASSQHLTPHWSPSSVEKGFFTPTISEVVSTYSSSSSSDSFEDPDALVDQLEGMSNLAYPDDSLVLFDRGNQSLDVSSSSTVTFLSEEGETPGSAIVSSSRWSSSSSGGRRTHRRERLRAMLCIQMEYCDCDLSKWLECRMGGQKLPFQKDVRDIFRDIVQGVVHIHSKSIIHRDLKPSNIFYSERDGAMKIGDFGLATLRSTVDGQARADGLRPYTTNLGTLPYMAPEQKERSDYDEKVDMYSLGIILFELLVPCKTRSEFHHMLNSVLKGEELPPELADRFPQYVDLVKNLLQTDPTLRMSAQEVLKHPMLQDTAEIEKRELLFEIKSLKLTLKRRERELEEAREEIAKLKAHIQRLNSASR